MNYNHERIGTIRELAAPNDIWTLGEPVESLLSNSLKRLPKKEVAEDERRYPTSAEGLRAFLDGFFARHYFQIQDSLLAYFASSDFEAVVERGVMNVADIGSGPAVASLAIADLAATALEAMSRSGQQRGNGLITIHCTLNDTSEICLSEGRAFLEKYNRMRKGRVSIGRILPLSCPFPDSNVHFRRIARMTAPYDICCLGYVLIPLSEQIGTAGTVEAIRRLSQTGNSTGGHLLLTQDKFREDLHRHICRIMGISAEMADLKQRVYDSQNQNAEHTYTYCRSCSTFSEIEAANSTVEVT